MHFQRKALFSKHDFLAALALLTRLPVRVDPAHAQARGADAAWAYPLVGGVVGLILAGAASFLGHLGLMPWAVAVLVLGLQLCLTGALHEDGLADSIDGLWGGWTRQRRLEIMKDSRTGVFGVCALVLTILLRWMALFTIIAAGAYWGALIAIAALSRMAMVILMGVMPQARQTGLSSQVGRPREATVWSAIAIGAGLATLCGWPLLIALTAATTLFCGLIARAKIGGQTGDILGATQQITECALLLAVMVALS